MTSRTASFLVGFALFGTIGLTVASLPAQTPLIGQAEAIDGDTIRLGGVRVRLWGIDAPEAHQTCLDASGRQWACGEAATHALRKMLAEGAVQCAPKYTDRYERAVATCIVSYREDAYDPGRPAATRYVIRDLGGLIVALGLAVDVPRYSHGAYRDEQAAAQAEKMGIWSGTFQAPAEWRRLHR